MTTIKLRRDTSANWTANNPVLATGEPGLETDTKKLKFGDGSTAWNSLSYATSGGTSGSISYNSLTDKPNLATVATSGSYNDLTNTPTIPSLPSFTFPSGNGTSNQVLQSNGDGTTTWVTRTSPIPSQSGNTGKFLTTDGSSTSWASVSGGTPYLFVESGYYYNGNWSTDINAGFNHSVTGGLTAVIWANPSVSPTISGASIGSGTPTNGNNPDWGNDNSQAKFYLPAGIYQFNVTGANWSNSNSDIVGTIYLNWSSDGSTWNTGSYGSSIGNSYNTNSITVFQGQNNEDAYSGRDSMDKAFFSFTTVRTLNAGWWILSNNQGWQGSGKISVMVTKLS